MAKLCSSNFAYGNEGHLAQSIPSEQEGETCRKTLVEGEITESAMLGGRLEGGGRREVRPQPGMLNVPDMVTRDVFISLKGAKEGKQEAILDQTCRWGKGEFGIR